MDRKLTMVMNLGFGEPNYPPATDKQLLYVPISSAANNVLELFTSRFQLTYYYCSLLPHLFIKAENWRKDVSSKIDSYDFSLRLLCGITFWRSALIFPRYPLLLKKVSIHRSR